MNTADLSLILTPGTEVSHCLDEDYGVLLGRTEDFTHEAVIRRRADKSFDQLRAAVVLVPDREIQHGVAQAELMRYLAWRYDIITVSTNYPSIGQPHEQPNKQIVSRQIQTCANTLRWLREHGVSIGVDANRIAILGAAVGGYLATMVSCTYDEPQFAGGQPINSFGCRPQALISLWPSTDVVASRGDNGENPKPSDDEVGMPLTHNSGQEYATNVLHQITGQLPPALFIQGRHDRIMPSCHAEPSHTAWLASGNRSELLLYDDRGQEHSSWSDDMAVLTAVGGFLQREFRLQVYPDTSAAHELTNPPGLQ